jgi:glyoxylase-like metal-dependent hydrolase (beta-lactamase superfamily II)
MTVVTKLNLSTSPGIWHISLPFQGEEEIIGSYVMAGNGELAIIDPGPASTADALLSALCETGFDPDNVTHLLLTHIHLDHAGGVGAMLPAMPKAKVYVHTKGAPHLIDPTKFLASASCVFGERMQELWGETHPIPADRIRVLGDGAILNIAGRRLEVHYAPGHAVHHVVFYDVHAGDLFAGDAAGMRLLGVDYVRPPTPPPDMDLEVWSNTINKLKRLRPDVLYLAHFGPVDMPIKHLERLRERLYFWGDLVLGAMRDGKDEGEIITQLSAYADVDLIRAAGNNRAVKRYELGASYAMCVQGLMRYWQKKYPELFPSSERV